MISLEQLLILVFFVIIIALINYSCFRIYQIKVVKENSLMYKKLTNLKSSFSFNKIITYYAFSDIHSSKYKFDKDTPVEFMSRDIYDNLDFYNNILYLIEDNENKYESFLNSYLKLESTLDKTNSRDFCNLKIEKFNKIEKRLYIKGKVKQPHI